MYSKGQPNIDNQSDTIVINANQPTSHPLLMRCMGHPSLSCQPNLWEMRMLINHLILPFLIDLPQTLRPLLGEIFLNMKMWKHQSKEQKRLSTIRDLRAALERLARNQESIIANINIFTKSHDLLLNMVDSLSKQHHPHCNTTLTPASPHPIDLIDPVPSSPSALSNSHSSESTQAMQNEEELQNSTEQSDSVFNVLSRKFAVVKELYKLSRKSC